MLALYSRWYKWCLSNSFFPFFFSSLQWSTNAEILPNAEIFLRETEKSRFSSFYRRLRLVCFFPSSSVEMHPFNFCAGKNVAFLPFWLTFCSFFCDTATQSSSTLYLYFCCYRSLKQMGTGPNYKLIRIKIIIFFPNAPSWYCMILFPDIV